MSRTCSRAIECALHLEWIHWNQFGIHVLHVADIDYMYAVHWLKSHEFLGLHYASQSQLIRDYEIGSLVKILPLRLCVLSMLPSTSRDTSRHESPTHQLTTTQNPR